MKRKILRGFTLIELIVVMALMSLLMVAIMQMFKPIRETFVDATVYEDQRTVQTGMVRYITESIRFSTDLGVYNTGTGGTSAQKAVEAFAQKYASVNGFTAAVSEPRYKKVLEEAEVIMIDNTPKTGTPYVPASDKHNWSAQKDVKGGHGRILRRKITNPPNSLSTNQPDASNIYNAGSPGVRDEWRLAMGTQYYGDKNDYTISLVFPTNAADGISVTVASFAKMSLKSQTKDAAGNLQEGVAISNSGQVVCMNLVGSGVGNNGNAGVKSPGMYDIDTSHYNSGIVSTGVTYIVFLNERI